MAYHGYVPLLKQILHQNKTSPLSVLEIGVDRGTTFLSLANWMARFKTDFFLLGIDIKVQEDVTIMARNIDRIPERHVIDIWEMNSLEALPKIAETDCRFDVVLIDGDHNYATVSRELSFLGAITGPNSVVLIDDYNGRWSERDLWYAERPGYEGCEIASKRVETEKHGVKAAVDEFLLSNPNWKSYQPIQGEPILLSQLDIKFESTNKNEKQ